VSLLARATGAFAPAGAGVREAALVLPRGAVLARPQATVVAVVSRLLGRIVETTQRVAPRGDRRISRALTAR
jgi:hypothetical protein